MLVKIKDMPGLMMNLAVASSDIPDDWTSTMRDALPGTVHRVTRLENGNQVYISFSLGRYYVLLKQIEAVWHEKSDPDDISMKFNTFPTMMMVDALEYLERTGSSDQKPKTGGKKKNQDDDDIIMLNKKPLPLLPSRNKPLIPLR